MRFVVSASHDDQARKLYVWDVIDSQAPRDRVGILVAGRQHDDATDIASRLNGSYSDAPYAYVQELVQLTCN